MAILNEQFRRMQKLAGIITEEQYMNEDKGIEQFEKYVSDMFIRNVDDGRGFEGVWEKEEYDIDKKWYGLTKYLKSVGGKTVLKSNPDIYLELLPNGNIKFGAIVSLDESLNEAYEFNPASYFSAMDSNDPNAKAFIQNIKKAADSDLSKRYSIVNKLKDHAKANPEVKGKLDAAIEFINS